ncbi:hypothetical protein ACVIHI_008743 [Bradyrhizobium sp. USDA 4524]|uniref:hypothetical protein n=1 Tax=unclassified Bradyrhizobium TaxID=2631580 RepID=UPI00209E00A3|nr:MULTISPECIES: hypothetical protein [unclassified Bradyrhizobium]MCP1845792.1 hypothetical protein [Bradyrhizobium sp. USDA 4538]MCP1906885.1 hypothetical protein [Bradyrhizobium sp. USDA 4537]MCP1985360.1 hypothetical protein [Bradyrhizobium sp. USDA 4539]
MDSEIFARLLVQKLTLVGLIKLLDHKEIVSKDLIIRFLEDVAANSDAATAKLSPLLADSVDAMIASIRETQPWKPIVIPGGKQ